MGLLRILLALSVIVNHSENFLGLRLVGGKIAVEAFFIISGFYMAMVLSEKYSRINKPYFSFISGRFLRLYPVYWSVLIFIALYSLCHGLINGNYLFLKAYLDHVENFSLPSYVYFIFSNLLIFGQDIIMFMGADGHGSLHFIKNFRLSHPAIHTFLLIAPAWSISLEMMFYLLAPLLNKGKTVLLFLLLAASFILKLVILNKGFNHDPWTYRFFPFELAYFILGMLSYRLFRTWKKKYTPLLQKIVSVYLISITIFYAQLPAFAYKDYVYLISIFIGIPFLFLQTKHNHTDRFIGEFSYVVYISHAFIIKLLLISSILPKNWLSEAATVLTLIFSWFIIELVSKKVERYRAQRLVYNTRKVQGK